MFVLRAFTDDFFDVLEAAMQSFSVKSKVEVNCLLSAGQDLYFGDVDKDICLACPLTS